MRLVVRLGRRKGCNINIDVKEMGWEGVGWLDLAWDRDRDRWEAR